MFRRNPYQTESKRDKNWRRFFWNIYEFWEVESLRDDARGGHEAGGTPQGFRRALDPRDHPLRRLEPFFRRKKANFRIEIVSKIQPNRSYGSPVIKETVKGQIWERRNRERQRDGSNHRGALAPPMPWRPRTRGETILPSREKVKEE